MAEPPINLESWAHDNRDRLARDAERIAELHRRYDGASLEDILTDLAMLTQFAAFRAHMEKLQTQPGERVVWRDQKQTFPTIYTNYGPERRPLHGQPLNLETARALVEHGGTWHDCQEWADQTPGPYQLCQLCGKNVSKVL